MLKVRTRFPPSPTGYLHIGNARTALFNYLFAKKHGGDFVVRIEDTDRERSEKRFEEDILDALEWLGISADEGPRQGGPYAPYRQSERVESYRPHLEKLLREELAFYCFHAGGELEEEKKSLMAAGKNPAHECEFRGLPLEEQEKMLAQKPEAIIRFKTPEARTISFADLVRGEISFSSGLLGDFSIAKDLETPLYNFAVVIDDAEMKISHVIRGEDHISNTPKQMLIQEALGFATPQYAHLPIILGPDRSKLSKRHGATSLREFREAGYLAETIVNFIALLGWNPGDNREIFSLAELVAEFDLAKVQKGGAVFNIEKLDWVNGEYIRKLNLEEIFEQAKNFLPQDYTLYPKPYTLKVLALEQPRLKKLAEIGERVDYFFREPEYDLELLRWKEMNNEALKESLSKSTTVIENLSWPAAAQEIEKRFLAEIGGGDKGPILWPLRAALSGKKASPGPFEIAAILGRDESLKRLEKALQKLGEN